MLPIFSHLKDKTKKHPYINHLKKEDFQVVTNVCGAFSSKTVTEMFKRPALAFLFVWFTKSSEAKKHMRDTLSRKKTSAKNYIDYMLKDIEKLRDNAFEVGLATEFQSEFQEKLVEYLNEHDREF